MSESSEYQAASTPAESHAARLWWMIGALVTVLVVVAAVVVVTNGSRDDAANAVAPGITKSMATLLQLDDIRSDHETEPSYRLTDQRGDPMTASEFRGRAVIFTLNDNHCEDLCTLLAQDIVAADRDLGREARRVAFVSINANPYYPSVAADAAWSRSHHLDALPNWYYGTGSPAVLKADWQKFGIPVEPNPKTKDIVHGTEMFFISPSGQEVELGQFGTQSADTAPFAHAMAQMAVDLLPSAQRTKVGGPALTSTTNGAALNSVPAAVPLHSLRNPATTLSTASVRGRYTVVNFWSSSCTACKQEMPGLEKTHHELGAKVNFLGDDVSDITHAGLAFAKQYGVTYPLMNDKAGTLSGAYRISGLPYTVVLDPKGRVVIRHAGAMTEEQLIYILQNMKGNGPDQSGMASNDG